MSSGNPEGGGSGRVGEDGPEPAPARRSGDLVWITPAVVAGCLAYVTYLATNPFPANGAGLYFAMAEVVSEHGYALPERVPHYAPGGIPFAYPPLAIYALALLRDVTGIGPLVLSRWLPGLVVLASVLPTYYLALELLESRPGAAVAATLVAVDPQLLDWHLTAGGLVRAPAFLFTVSGLYAGLRLFRSEEPSRRWLGLSVACFLATVLTHPTYTLFFAASYVVLFVGIDRSVAGFVRGAIVGVGGLVLAAPWWITVIRTHGPDVYLGALGTHGGVVGGLVARAAAASLEPLESTLVVLGGLSVLAGLATGRLLLAAWLVVVSLVHSQPRFTLFVWSFLVVAVLLTIVRRLRATGRASFGRSLTGRSGPALVLVLAILLSALTGAGYIRDDTAAPRITITANSVDGAHLEAMTWARTCTPPDASYVVLGDASEWFPLFAERTLLVSPWGTEWRGSRTYARHVSIYRTVSFCGTGRCLAGALERHDLRPDYVYVPTDRFPVQGTPRAGAGAVARGLERTDRYVPVFENADVVILRRGAYEGGRTTECDGAGRSAVASA